MNQALGLLETKGLIAAIEAADAMVKAADIKIVSKEKSTAALVTIKIVGDTAAVRAALDAGAVAAQKVGQLLSVHLIPSPDDQIDYLIKNTEKIVTKPGGDEVLEKSSYESAEEKPKPDTEIENLDVTDSIEDEEEISEEIEPEESESDESDPEEAVSGEIVEGEDEPSVELPYESAPVEEEIHDEDAEAEEEFEEPGEESIEIKPDEEQLFEENEPESSESSEEETLDTDDDQDHPTDFSTSVKNIFEDFAEKDESKEPQAPILNIPIEEKPEPPVLESLFGEAEEEKEMDYDGSKIPSMEELEHLSVPELRKLARSVENFPIKGREISKANKQILLSYFKML